MQGRIPPLLLWVFQIWLSDNVSWRTAPNLFNEAQVVLIMEEVNNPALSQEPRFEPAIVIPLKQKASLLDWLQSNNRLIPRERDVEVKKLSSSQDDVEELLDNDDYDSDFEED